LFVVKCGRRAHQLQGRDLLALDVNELRGFRHDAQIILQDPYASLNPRMTVSQLPPPDAVVPADGGFSPALERLVAAFSGSTKIADPPGVETAGTMRSAAG
jgi:hypothetical protein